ncbi:MAG: succinylglutamate desuccinylase/aspartoacylase family protein [Acidobacteriota bacterium]|nr:succinylglutamate desuccinylase/aspartoacylase family protein [Acidobacteriota bacterium]
MPMSSAKTDKRGKRRASSPLFGLVIILALLATAGFFAARDFLSMRAEEPIRPSAGLTSIRPLSSYFPALAGTPGDTDVYVFKGREEGGRVLILGGTHPNEPAGYVSAVVLIENLRVDRGTIFIIPRANRSGFTHSDPQEASPQRYAIETPSGRRFFRLGSRVTNPVHQWPDPTIYVNPGGQALAGIEARNLNRAYPGRPRGNLTERVAFGVMELIRRERIGLGLDLHESAPEYPVINALVFNEAAADLAATAQMSLQDQGLDFRLEASPPNLRGLSHREWGEAAGIKAVLIETPNASHGRLKGRPSASLVVDGRDKFYVRAAGLGRLYVPFGPEGIPLRDRVARHLAGVAALLAGLADLEPENAVGISGLPDPDGIRAGGVGAFLRRPPGGRP